MHITPPCGKPVTYIQLYADVMTRSYNIKYLSQETVAKAYPVIRAAYPNVTLDDWLAYTAWINQPADARRSSTGIVSLENMRGYVHGIFSYNTDYMLGTGPVLNVENIVALDTGDRAAAVTQLISAMEDVAINHGCATIHTQIPEFWTSASAGRTGLHAHLVDAGHDREMIRFSKHLQKN